ncbi:MAG: hypothetical protein EOO20_11890 [Chryseobacterium sp.]|nr:MAG: hypothetical protein EOO20_11890 [Chryseobacterium sp.]
MKQFQIILSIGLLFLMHLNMPGALARDPGPTKGCLVWNYRFFTVWSKTDQAPGNSGWGPHEYYTTASPNYEVVDNDKKLCGTINPYGGSTSDAGVTCWVDEGGGIFRQGALTNYDGNTVKTCNLPLDDYISYIIPITGLLGFFLQRKNSHSIKLCLS